jgi:hypothetical protein
MAEQPITPEEWLQNGIKELAAEFPPKGLFKPVFTRRLPTGPLTYDEVARILDEYRKDLEKEWKRLYPQEDPPGRQPPDK